MRGRWRDFATIVGGAAILYLPLSLVRSPDLSLFLIPWLEHIRTWGPVLAFAHPFSNYTPPYLYLLSAFSLLHAPDAATIKLLAIAGAAWLAWCVGRFVHLFGGDALRGAERTILLPTVILNAAVLGQCDTFWVGFCILALGAAIKDQPYRMAAWAGVAFAFKAQAAFLAPFCVAFLIRKRAWTAAPIPILIYGATIAPAALVGWPLVDLLTVYVRQTDFTFIGDAPNLWAIPFALGVRGPSVFVASYVLGALAALLGVWLSLRAKDLSKAALVSSMLPVFFLAKMLPRFFLFADVLSLAIAFVRRDRASITTAVLISARVLPVDHRLPSRLAMVECRCLWNHVWGPMLFVRRFGAS